MKELLIIENNEISVKPEVFEKLQQYNKIRIKADMLEQELKAELKEAMEKHGIKSIQNEVFTATYIAPQTRQRLDTALLKKELPEVAEVYTTTSEVKSSIRVKFND